MQDRLHKQEINLISLVHTHGVKHEKLIYEYLRDMYQKITVERVFMDDMESYLTHLMQKGMESIVITHRNNTEFISQYVQSSVVHSGKKMINIFVN
jgi:phosphoglycolate phosphatase-like HAD superfamily hydrolase